MIIKNKEVGGMIINNKEVGGLIINNKEVDFGSAPSTISLFSAAAKAKAGVYANLEAPARQDFVDNPQHTGLVISQARTTHASLANWVIPGSLENSRNDFILYYLVQNKVNSTFTVSFAGTSADWANFRDFNTNIRNAFNTLYLVCQVGNSIASDIFSTATRDSLGQYTFPRGSRLLVPNGTDAYKLAIVKNDVPGLNLRTGMINA